MYLFRPTLSMLIFFNVNNNNNNNNNNDDDDDGGGYLERGGNTRPSLIFENSAVYDEGINTYLPFSICCFYFTDVVVIIVV